SSSFVHHLSLEISTISTFLPEAWRCPAIALLVTLKGSFSPAFQLRTTVEIPGRDVASRRRAPPSSFASPCCGLVLALRGLLARMGDRSSVSSRLRKLMDPDPTLQRGGLPFDVPQVEKSDFTGWVGRKCGAGEARKM